MQSHTMVISLHEYCTFIWVNRMAKARNSTLKYNFSLSRVLKFKGKMPFFVETVIRNSSYFFLVLTLDAYT